MHTRALSDLNNYIILNQSISIFLLAAPAPIPRPLRNPATVKPTPGKFHQIQSTRRFMRFIMYTFLPAAAMAAVEGRIIAKLAGIGAE